MSDDPANQVDATPQTKMEAALSTIADAIKEMATLKVQTIISDTYDPTAEDPGPITGDMKAARTVINLVDGDITTSVPADFFDAENESFRTFHLEREKQAEAIIETNMEAMARTAKTLFETLKK